MLTQYEKNLSNLSYTNKDFQTIYPELLDLVSKISYKWDPSVSDESDPGVVLLKLAALMADKNNYNIDKNILELFPLSVTQETNARQLFEQLGYSMRYYQAATMNIQLTLNNPPELSATDLSDLGIPEDADLTESKYNLNYKLPRFTMVSDEDNSVVYTLTQDVNIGTDGITVSIPAIQGTANNYLINGQSTITIDNLDYKNRLYFTELDIAENGIFITTVGNPYEYWSKVDNLILQPIGTKCYKFGLSDDGTKCFIEFPSDIDSLIESGLNITYIRTNGLAGNIGAKHITQFFVDTEAERHLITSTTTQKCTISAENVFISNPLAAIDGKDPETIDEAFIQYQRVKNTFGTLVSLSDYTNFMISNKNVSNGYVCDRTNDIQSAYKILNTETTNNNNFEHYVQNNLKTKTLQLNDTKFTPTGEPEKTISGVLEYQELEPEMNAFDLKVYALAYVDNVNHTAAYQKSFEIIENSTLTVSDMYNLHSDSTGWGELKTIQHDFKNYEPYRMIMLKNRYFIDAKIIPQYKVSQVESNDLKTKIYSELYLALNSKQIKFGEMIDYNLVYDTILNADPRIKALILQDITYETYAAYPDNDGHIQYLQIDSTSTQPDYTSEEEKEVDKSKTPHDLWTTFRHEIFAKSVLKGVTQYLNSEDEFTHSLRENKSETITDAYFAKTNTQVQVINLQDNLNLPRIFRKLGDNENLIFTAPNLLDDIPYGVYVKYFYHFAKFTDKNTKLPANCDYTLSPQDFIVFVWSDEDGTDGPAQYKYVKYQQPDENKDPITISPSFAMNTYQGSYSIQIKDVMENAVDINVATEVFAHLPITGSTPSLIPHTQMITSDPSSPFANVSLNTLLSKLNDTNYCTLSGSKQIKTRKLNKIHINNKTGNGTNKVYWILNNISNIGDKKYYTLFNEGSEEGEGVTSYTLKTGESLLYGNHAQTHLVILGSGTKITRKSTVGSWKVEALNESEILMDPFKYLDDYWFTIDETETLEATEQQFYQIGSGYEVVLHPSSIYKDLYEGENDIIAQGMVIESTQLTRSFLNGGPTTTRPGFTNAPIYDFEIQLQDKSSDIVSSINLPYRNHPAYGWTARSLFNINCSPTNPQRVYQYQSIDLYNNSTLEEAQSSEPILHLPITTDDDIPFYFMLDREVALTGGSHFIDLTLRDLLANEINPSTVYTYVLSTCDEKFISGDDKDFKLADTSYIDQARPVWEEVWQVKDSSTEVVAKLPINNCSYYIKSQDDVRVKAKYILPITLPKGKYILPIHLSESTDELIICHHEITPGSDNINIPKSSKIELIEFQNSSSSTYKTYGNHLLYMELNPSDTTKEMYEGYLSIYYKNEQTEGRECLLTFQSPYHYVYKHQDIAETEQDILPVLLKYDLNGSNTSIFNYIYQVPEDTLIENPLLAKSFLDSNHPYNPFVIAEWDINDLTCDGKKRDRNKCIIEDKIK